MTTHTITFETKALMQLGDRRRIDDFIAHALMDFRNHILREVELQRFDGQPITENPTMDPL